MNTLWVTAINAVIERLWAASEGEDRAWLRLHGHPLAVHWKEWQTPFYWVFDEKPKLQTQLKGAASAEVTLSLAGLRLWQQNVPLTTLIEQQHLSIHGDLDVAQAWMRCLQSMKPDVEEMLSQYLGDAFAHQAVYQTKTLAAQLKEQHEKNQKWLGEVLMEEWRWLPSELEIAHFADQVDDLASDVACLSERVMRFTERKLL